MLELQGFAVERNCRLLLNDLTHALESNYGKIPPLRK
jgi:hypothetical protein